MPEDSNREIGNLKAIKDNFPKYVVTMDSSVCGMDDGIKIVHVKDFLSREWLWNYKIEWFVFEIIILVL